MPIEPSVTLSQCKQHIDEDILCTSTKELNPASATFESTYN